MAPSVHRGRVTGRTELAFIVVSVATLWLPACSAPSGTADAPATVTVAEHVADVEEWRAWRRGTLEQPDGWLSLDGLIWLEEGESTFGSDPSSDIVYAEHGTPLFLGTFFVDGETARYEAAPDVVIGIVDSDEVVTSIVARQPPVEGADPVPTPVMTWGPLRWHVIQRREQLAIRLKDAMSPVLTGFDGIDMFPIQQEWRVAARFEFYDPVKPIMIPNILGTVGEGESPGAVIFEYDGETYRLDMWKDSDDPENFFTAFGDATNRDSTYGGGRFIWVDAPDANGHTVIDFNKAYNPPCVFTPYSTCPLPPGQLRPVHTTNPQFELPCPRQVPRFGRELGSS